VRNVGLARRADLVALPAGGPPEALEAATADLIGHALAVGGSARIASAWWCRPDAQTLLLVAPPEALDRTVALLRTLARRRPRLAIDAGVEPLEAIGVVGHRTTALLRSLGVYGPVGDPRATPPCRSVILAEARTTWLLESDFSAICFVAPAAAVTVERRILDAGRPLALARVGRDALAQYHLLERRRAVTGLSVAT
jgi:hypothetical protein